MIYSRAIFPILEKELETKENTVITGMRQVGKTTILEYLFSLVKTNNRARLDFENPLHRKVFEEENYDTIWNNLAAFGITNTQKAFIFLDEVQHLPNVSKVVKYLSDHWDVKFVLTGSSSYYLKNLFPESMAGRKLVFEIFPLTFPEFLVFKGIGPSKISSFTEKAKSKNRIAYKRLAPYYEEYMEFGAFPRIVLETDLTRKRALLLEIFKSYFEQDAKTLADFKDTSKLRDLILLLIPRIGSRIEIAKLADSISVSRETVYNYLAFLEHTYFITLLSKFSGSIDRQAAGSKKLFLCDGGLANVLGKISEGQLFEQSIFQNLRTKHTLNFYHKNGSEIDFIVDNRVALEVKTTVSRRDIAHLKARAQVLKIPEYYVVANNYSNEKEVVLAADL
ncbi:MAG: ATP-binding protein [Candidatus Daviesbacteria bacterium]|nr:ATP-binding protein [Candidatus Daviesbacteria bacterium]